MDKEIFKDIPGYEGLYQVSNQGRVKSFMKGKEKILKQPTNSSGYLQVTIYRNGAKIYKVHALVAMAFLNHTPCGHNLVVDHINDDKLDNRVENLQVVTQRFNACKTQGRYTSKYKGVSWRKDARKWISRMYINGKLKHLGYFKCELAASYAYQMGLKSLLSE